MMNSPRPLRRVWRHVRPNAGWSALSILLACLSLFCAIGLIATSAWLISRAWQQPPILYLTVAVVSVRAFGIGRGVFRYTERLVSHSAALRGLTNLRVTLVERIADVAPGGVRWLRPGDAVRRLVDDVDTTAEFGLRTLLPSTAAVLVGGAVVAFVAWLVPMAGVALLIGLLIAGLIAPWLTARVARAAAHIDVQVVGELAGEINAALHNCEDLVAANAQGHAQARVRELDAQLLRAQSRMAHGMGASAAVSVFAQALALIGVILVAVPAVTSGQLNGVNLAVVVFIPLVAFEAVAGLPAAAIAWARARSSSQRIVDILDAPNVVPDPTTPVAASSHCDLKISDLTIQWDREEQPAVADLSFQLLAGAKVSLTGPSGSGKSSVAAALVKFVEGSGQIELGGVDYRKLRGDTVREHVVLSEQCPHIFDNTIEANIKFARPDASDEQIVAAIEKARLGAWVKTLPEGIQTQVGEYGQQVSGGQRQRIALARVLLSPAKVVILDEPTEHLDAETAEELLDDIFVALADRSVLLITHDPLAVARTEESFQLNR